MKQKTGERPFKIWGFGLRLAAAYGLIFAVVLSLTGFFLLRNLHDQTLERIKESLLQDAQLIGSHFSSMELTEENRKLIQQQIKNVARENRSRITVIAADGAVLGDSVKTHEEVFSMENHAARPEVRTALRGSTGWSIRHSRTLETRMLYAAVPLVRNNKTEGVLRLALSLGQVEAVLGAVKTPIIYGLIIGILISSLVSIALGHSMGGRISEITQAACRYAGGDLSKKIFVKGDDEVRLLAHAMNQMAIALKKRIGEAEAERKKLGVILQNMAEGVIAVNKDREILLANPSAERIFQCSPGYASGKSLLTVTKKPQIDEMMAESIRSEKSFQREIEIIRPEAKALRAYFLWVGSIEEEICGILVLTDITQIKKLENLRREFVANVSHELRTPLTSIRGFIETLLHGALEDPETGKRFLKMVDEDARRLERLIGDLMEISKLEAKQTPLHKERLSLETETAHAAESLRPLLTEKKISLHNHLEGKKLPQVFADSDKLQQILVNLLDNAIKFNKTGGEIHIEAEEEAGFVKVLVKDTGMGIPAEAVGRLFERFYRVDKARSREVGGTGLGLSIVKHLAEAHGGIAGCESEPGAGSTFFFTIPAA